MRTNNTMQQKKMSCLSEFFFGKKFCYDPKKIPTWLVSLELRSKSRILAVFGVFGLLCTLQHCSHSRTSTLVQLVSLESSDPFYKSGSTRKSLWGPGGTIQEHLL